jgi:hypothetical protein
MVFLILFEKMNYNKKSPKPNWKIFIGIPILLMVIIAGIVFILGKLTPTFTFLLLIGFLTYFGIIGLYIRLFATYSNQKLSEMGEKRQKIFATAILISVMTIPIWIISFSIFTTRTDISDIDPILIERGIIEDTSSKLYIPSAYFSALIFFITFIQTVILYLIFRPS